MSTSSLRVNFSYGAVQSSGKGIALYISASFDNKLLMYQCRPLIVAKQGYSVLIDAAMPRLTASMPWPLKTYGAQTSEFPKYAETLI